MCHKETVTEEPARSPLTEGLLAEVRFKAVNEKTPALICVFLRGATGSTDGARRKRIKLLPNREGEVVSGTFPRPQKSTATVAQVPKESLSLSLSASFHLPSASLFSIFSISLQFSQVLLLQSVSE